MPLLPFSSAPIQPTTVTPGAYTLTNITVNKYGQVTAAANGTGGGGGDMLVATYDPAGVSEQLVGRTAAQVLTNKDVTSGTNTFPTFNQNTTGSAAKWTTARNLAGNSVDGSANVAFANKFVVQGTADTGLSAAQFLGALGTGIVKNTTTTGVLSIAVAGDFPTLNQNTSGSAATLTTPRAINGVNFDGSAAITVPSIVWTEVTGTSQTAAVNNGYITNNVGLVTVTLPSTAALGSMIEIAGKGAGGWKVAQAASVSINFGNTVTTTGTGGSLASTNTFDTLRLLCTTANTGWVVLSSVGNITVV